MIALQLTSNARDVLGRIDRLPTAMLRIMALSLDETNQGTLAHIQKNKLSQRGPKTLGVVTNRLRGSSRAAKTTIQGTALYSNLGANVPYARTHEFGFSGKVNVPGFWRRVPQGDRFSVGTAIVSRAMADRLGAFGKNGRPRRHVKQVSSGRAYVRPHARTLNFPERAMFRTGIQERKAVYGTALSSAIVKAWENP